MDSGKDLNAYAKVENQSGCCSPAMDSTSAGSCCCSTAKKPEDSLHTDLKTLLEQYDINAAAASVKVYAIKGGTGA